MPAGEMRGYTIETRTDEDGRVTAYSPSLPGMTAVADTEKEAVTALSQDIISRIEAMCSAGLGAPYPDAVHQVYETEEDLMRGLREQMGATDDAEPDASLGIKGVVEHLEEYVGRIRHAAANGDGAELYANLAALADVLGQIGPQMDDCVERFGSFDAFGQAMAQDWETESEDD